jgi:hypothetical protein
MTAMLRFLSMEKTFEYWGVKVRSKVGIVGG